MSDNYFTNALDLLEFLDLSPSQVNYSAQATESFKCRVPLAYAKKMVKGCADDPLLLQVLPDANELLEHPDFCTDPLIEQHYISQPGLLKKYHGRALIVTTSRCAIHCRYCFRRHFPYQNSRQSWQQLIDNIQAIAEDKSINEVILSGGDPLSLSDNKISDTMTMLEAISHVTRVRIHSRFPTVVPDRITPQLVEILKTAKLRIIIVLHINHPDELDQATVQGIRKLQFSGATLYNQSVLLKGINDCTKTLVRLSDELFNAGVQPYYLHLLDKVAGSRHFDIDEQRALKLYHETRELLPGYLVPTLVREIPDSGCKTPLY